METEPDECPKCGTIVPDTAAECAYCGYTVDAWPSETEAEELGRRPAWVWAVFGLYALIFAALVLAPLGISLADKDPNNVLVGAAVSVGLFVIGYGLTVIPIGQHWYTPPRRRSVALPLIASATCAAALAFGACLASAEFFRVGGKGVVPAAAVGAAAVWVGWTVVFLGVSRSVSRGSLGERLYRRLLAGSVMELLVAIPMHMIVRRRDECCAGMFTGLGIGIGLVVLVLALGPAVFVLCFRRYRQVYSRRR